MFRVRLMLIRILIGAFFLFSINPAFSASISGTKCTKVGTNKTIANIKYTCIKLGRNIVWDKGKITKVVTTPSPRVSPTPSPTPSPTHSVAATPTPSSTSSSTPSSSPTPVVLVAGDRCLKQGEISGVGASKLVCRRIANGSFVYFALTSSFTTESNPKSPDSLATCRLSDQRPTVTPEGTQITYPITPHVLSKKSGVEKIAIVGFDFNDSPGQGSPLDIYGESLEKAASFFNWYSNGKVTFEYATYDKWIRLSKPSSSYETGEHFSTLVGSLTVEQMATEFNAAISQYINLSGFTAVWFVYPKTIEKITQNYGLAAGNLPGLPAFYGFGPNNYAVEIPLWTYFIHEMLHEQGLQGHSPKAPWRFGVLLNGDGYTAGMNSWDELSVDWMVEDEIYCVDKANLKPVQIKLAPIERQQSGIHSVMIKLDNHRALVIESHRSGDFAPGMPEYGYGVTLQLVDTIKSTSWNDDLATSIYLQFANNERYGPEYGTRIDNKRANESGYNLYNGRGVSGARWGLDQNYLLLQGESYNFEGIKIDFISSGNTDLIAVG
jgi:hypothetical protein